MGEKDMYATKRLRGLLALWLVLLLVLGLGTTVYAAEYYVYKDDSLVGPGLYDEYDEKYEGALYPGDTVENGMSGNIMVVYYQDRAAYVDSGATYTFDTEFQGIPAGTKGYYNQSANPSITDTESHGIVPFLNSASTKYTYEASFVGGRQSQGGTTLIYKLTLIEAGDGAPPSSTPEPTPSPTPAPTPPIRCDLPVLFDPIGPVDKYGGAGGSVTMSVSARDALRFQWQVNYQDGTGWHNVEGAVTDTYTLENLDAIHEGWQFRCVVRNNCGPVISPNFTVHVHVPVAEVPATGGPGAALAALALGLASLGAGLGVSRKRRG